MNKKGNRRKRTRKKDRKEIRGGAPVGFGSEGDYEWFSDKYKPTKYIKEIVKGSAWQKTKTWMTSLRRNNTVVEFSPYQYRLLEIGQKWQEAMREDEKINSDTWMQVTPGGTGQTEMQRVWEDKLREVGGAQGGALPHLPYSYRTTAAPVVSTAAPVIATAVPVSVGEATTATTTLVEPNFFNEISHRVEFCRDNEVELKSIIRAVQSVRASKNSGKEVTKAIMTHYINSIDGSHMSAPANLTNYFGFRDWLGQDENKWGYGAGVTDSVGLKNRERDKARRRGQYGALAATAATVGVVAAAAAAAPVTAAAAALVAAHTAKTARNISTGVGGIITPESGLLRSTPGSTTTERDAPVAAQAAPAAAPAAAPVTS